MTLLSTLSFTRQLLQTPRQMQRLNRTAGGVMVTAGVVIANRS